MVGLLYAESVRGRASQLMGIRYAAMVLQGTLGYSRVRYGAGMVL